jgi:hypothetical protein
MKDELILAAIIGIIVIASLVYTAIKTGETAKKTDEILKLLKQREKREQGKGNA